MIAAGEEYVRLPEEVARVMFAAGEKIDQVCNEKFQDLQWNLCFTTFGFSDFKVKVISS